MSDESVELGILRKEMEAMQALVDQFKASYEAQEREVARLRLLVADLGGKP